MSYQEQSTNWIFIETWVDTGLPTPRVKLLICRNENLYQVVNPSRDYATDFSSTTYNEAAFWLGEDEYEQVGRVMYGD